MEKVRCLSEYLDLVKYINDEYFDLKNSTTYTWYRGQANSEWSLVPSLYRGEFCVQFERELNRDFQLSASPFLKHLPKHELEWLFVMQHYGAPTRLLDWTEGALVALFFAVENIQCESDATVWTLHPWKLNEWTLKINRVPLASDDEMSDYCLGDPSTVNRRINAMYPAAIRPSRMSSRILAQRGAFTIHGCKISGIQRLNMRKKFLQRIYIEGKAKREIRRELLMVGIGRNTIFPELDNLGRELAYRYSEDCMSL
ncbi:MAG: FRG domain-containing protein [Candidatus Aegiribacteria sp.]|nr:FRG domain-containing protein [Candidatus Aegiribacteria sp.]